MESYLCEVSTSGITAACLYKSVLSLYYHRRTPLSEPLIMLGLGCRERDSQVTLRDDPSGR